MSVRLERPAPPLLAAPATWPGRVIAVFGVGERPFATALAGGLGARLVRTALRRSEGFTWDGEVLVAHPDTLAAGLVRARADARWTVGVGPAFAVGVQADVRIHLRDGAPLGALPAALRPLARRAHLVLEEPRLGVARALARALDP